MSHSLENKYSDQMKNTSVENISLENQNFLYFPIEKQQLQENEFSILRNFWPDTKGPIIRGGCKKICKLSCNSSITSAFSYKSNKLQRVFITNNQEIYDVTNYSTIQSENLCVSNMKSGEWITFHYTTSEKTFLIALNGQDERQVYDGNEWKSDNTKITFNEHNKNNPIYFSYGWIFKNRQWYIELDSMDAWYLPPKSLGGVAKFFPLGGVMQEGGELLAGFSWSNESDDGLSTLCIFLSNLGELAVYGGDDPDVESSFSLKAISYWTSIREKAIVFVKNDVLIATKNGLISIRNTILQENKNNLPLSWPIQEEWEQAVMVAPTGWSMTLWEEKNMLLISYPQNSISSHKTFVMNVDHNNRWASFHNWFTKSYVVSNENLFFGDYDGNFWQGDVTGSDNMQPFTAVYLSPFHEIDPRLGFKRKSCVAHISLLSCQRPYIKLFSRSNYDYTYPDFSKETINNHLVNNCIWDNSLWDEVKWTDEVSFTRKKLFNFCQNVVAYGNFLAVGFVIVSSGQFINDIQIKNAKLLVE
ncbi:hypothetical protein [Candidatus Liberibacter brunswickensis]|uniref:hypothetical protein n=1 Tax=Candidatus Liberibacter brunswickensis TaxID=1968796 RepID=UPI002FE27F4E